MNTKYKDFESPGVTVDLVLFTVNENYLKVMLVKRAEEPFRNDWSLPGGFIKVGESLDDAAQRVLVEKTGVSDVYMEQLYTFGGPKRDPRSRVITVAYIALIPWKSLPQPESEKVIDPTWSPVAHLPKLFPIEFDFRRFFQEQPDKALSDSLSPWSTNPHTTPQP